jgi:hypothetical protein
MILAIGRLGAGTSQHKGSKNVFSPETGEIKWRLIIDLRPPELVMKGA